MKLGFYGGSFDPIHHGHLLLARDAVETLGLERLFFIPAAVSPHKLGARPGPSAAPAAVRAAMIRAAIEDEPRFGIEELELQRAEQGAPVSYTIDTILALRERYGGEAAFYYLIGQDNLAKLDTWRRIDELRRLATFVVLARDVADVANGAQTPLPFQTLARRIDISATEIRNRIANGLSIRYLVPERVRDLLLRHQLYQS